MIFCWIFIIMFFIFLLSYLATGFTRGYTIKRNILDIPNIRSSHSTPTPRGGGVAIVLLFLLGISILSGVDLIPGRLAVALCGGGLLVAIVGWIDDCYSLKISLRAIVHFIAAIWAVLWLKGLPSINLGIASISLNTVGSALAVIGVVWFINLYNFMDGIDGIAASEAVFVGLVGGMLSWVAGLPGLAMVSWFLAASSAGFLIWNWSPAKIFMGDVGSGFLGYCFAVIALANENNGGLPLLGWFILLAVFIIDATATLLLRIYRGERWYEPHRCHVYQLAVQAGFNHQQVSLAAMGLNVVLAILALISWCWPGIMLWMFVVSNMGLVCFYRFWADHFGRKQILESSISGRIQV